MCTRAAALFAELDGALAESDGMGNSLATRLRRAREQKGWTLQDLSGAAGVDKSMLSRLESGDRDDVRLSTAVALCRALDISVDHLAGLNTDRRASVADLKALERRLNDALEHVRRALKNQHS